MFGHPDWLTCCLCGRTEADVAVALIRWSKPGSKDPAPFGSGPRCRDRVACADRQRAEGLEIEAMEATPVAQVSPALSGGRSSQ